MQGNSSWNSNSASSRLNSWPNSVLRSCSNRLSRQGDSSWSSSSASSKLSGWNSNNASSKLSSWNNNSASSRLSSWNNNNASSKLTSSNSNTPSSRLSSWRNSMLRSFSNSRQGNKRTKQGDSSWNSSTSSRLNSWRSSTLRRCSNSRNNSKSRGVSWKLKHSRVIRKQRDHPTRSLRNFEAARAVDRCPRRVNAIEHSPLPYSWTGRNHPDGACFRGSHGTTMRPQGHREGTATCGARRVAR